MDGTDRRIFMTQTVRVGSDAMTIEELTSRQKVIVRLSAVVHATTEDLAAMIRMLTVAKERLEALGAVEALEKVVGS